MRIGYHRGDKKGVRPMRIGLTGGIATGKSRVSQYVHERHGFDVLDGDRVAREMVEGDHSPQREMIFEAFGQRVRKKDGTLNRAMLSRIVFSDPQEMEKLKSIMVPQLHAILEQHMHNFHRSRKLVCDFPLLFEREWHKRNVFDAIVVVSVSAELHIERLCHRDHITRAEAKLRIASQWPLTMKCALADYVIHNDGPIEQTFAQVDAVVAQLQHGERVYEQ
jgi:dephospho-CoA kinase